MRSGACNSMSQPIDLTMDEDEDDLVQNLERKRHGADAAKPQKRKGEGISLNELPKQRALPPNEPSASFRDTCLLRSSSSSSNTERMYSKDEDLVSVKVQHQEQGKIPNERQALLRGKRFYVADVSVSRSRMLIFRKRIKENGGSFVESLEAGADYFLCDKSCENKLFQKEAVRKLWRKCRGAKELKSLEWMSDMLQEKAWIESEQESSIHSFSLELDSAAHVQRSAIASCTLSGKRPCTHMQDENRNSSDSKRHPTEQSTTTCAHSQGSGKEVLNIDSHSEVQDVVLKHTECQANEKFVRHLDLLSFLIELDAHRKAVTLAGKPCPTLISTAKIKSWVFKQASNVVRRLPGVVRISGDGNDIYVGQDYCSKINCIAESTITELSQVQEHGTSARLQDLKSDNPDYTCIQELTLVHQVGLATAVKLFYEEGIRSWQDLRQYITTPQPKMKFGIATAVFLEHFESIHEQRPVDRNDPSSPKVWGLRRILRQQVEQVRKMVHTKAESVGGNRVLQTVAAGSYRRGCIDSGDIDLVLQGLDGEGSRGLVADLVKALEREGLLIHMQQPSDGQLNPFTTYTGQHVNYVSERYMGLVCIGKVGEGLKDADGSWCRLDITLYERKCFLYGLFQWTGSTQLNREMRRKALKMKPSGCVLNEFGIFINMPNRNNKTVMGTPVDGCFDISDEKGIFKLIGMQYLEPHERSAGSQHWEQSKKSVDSGSDVECTFTDD